MRQAGPGLGVWGCDCPAERAVARGARRVHLVQPGPRAGRPRGGPHLGERGRPGPWSPGTRSFERAVLGEVEVQVPVSVSCFSSFSSQTNFGKF